MISAPAAAKAEIGEEGLGGKENVASIDHCITRLRPFPVKPDLRGHHQELLMGIEEVASARADQTADGNIALSADLLQEFGVGRQAAHSQCAAKLKSVRAPVIAALAEAKESTQISRMPAMLKLPSFISPGQPLAFLKHLQLTGAE